MTSNLHYLKIFISVPALSMAALVLVMVLNPFSGHLQTVDELVALSIANHLDTSMEMASRTGEVADVGQWFTQRLRYAVRLPDLKRLGLNLIFELAESGNLIEFPVETPGDAAAEAIIDRKISDDLIDA